MELYMNTANIGFASWQQFVCLDFAADTSQRICITCCTPILSSCYNDVEGRKEV